jgi:hypothetical protein
MLAALLVPEISTFTAKIMSAIRRRHATVHFAMSTFSMETANPMKLSQLIDIIEP